MFKNQQRLFYFIIAILRITNISLFTVYFLYLTNVVGLSNSQALLLDLPLFLAQFVFELPTGFFADRYGLKKSVIISFILLCIVSILYFSTTNYLILFCAGILSGAGWAFFSGAFEAYAIEIFGSDSKKFFTNRQIIENSISIIAPILTIWLTQFIGYKIFYLFDFLIKIIIVVIIIFGLKNISQSKMNERFGLEFLRFGFKSVAKEIKNSSPLLNHSFASMFWGFGILGIDIFTTKIIANSSGESTVGIAFSLTSICAVIAGILVAKMKNLNFVYWFSFLANAIFVILCAMFYEQSIVLVLVICRGFVYSLHDTVSPIIINQIIKNNRASILSFFSFLSNIGKIVGTFFTAYFVEKIGIDGIWIICGLTFVIITFFLFKVQRGFKINENISKL